MQCGWDVILLFNFVTAIHLQKTGCVNLVEMFALLNLSSQYL